MLAKTLFGFEELLARELRELGAGDIEIGTRSVGFSGDTGFMYKANLCCRTAIKILKPLRSFVVKDEKRLLLPTRYKRQSQLIDKEVTVTRGHHRVLT